MHSVKASIISHLFGVGFSLFFFPSGRVIFRMRWLLGIAQSLHLVWGGDMTEQGLPWGTCVRSWVIENGKHYERMKRISFEGREEVRKDLEVSCEQISHISMADQHFQGLGHLKNLNWDLFLIPLCLNVCCFSWLTQNWLFQFSQTIMIVGYN